MLIKKNIATSESGFIFNPSTGDSFTANPIASEIIQALKLGESLSAIKKNIMDKYDVDGGQLERDMDDFMSQLKDGNLLES